MAKTNFELAQEQVANGTLRVPTVSNGSGNINYFGYQLAVHHYNLKLMAKGMGFRNITLTQIKKYYGLKGRSAADCLPRFEEIMNEYKGRFEAAKAAVGA
jgi:hypothetical protein